MGISYEKRLAGKDEEVLRTVVLFNEHRAMSIYKLLDYLSFTKWMDRKGRRKRLAEIRETIPAPVSLGRGGMPSLDSCIQQAIETISSLRAALQREREEKSEIGYELEKYKSGDYEKHAAQIYKLWEVCA